MSRLLIKGGNIVNADGIQYNTDVYIEGKIIKDIGENIEVSPETQVVDAKDRYVMPGGIDTHTHMQLPFMSTVAIDDFYSGTRAALAGGTTMIMDFVIPQKGQSLIEAYSQWRDWADEKVCCDYSLHMVISYWNESVRQEMSKIVSKDIGINSFKMFMAYKDVLMLNDTELLDIFKEIRALGALAQVHAENGHVIAENQERLLKKGIWGPEGHVLSRPEDLETEAVFRASVLSSAVYAPLYIVHVMSQSAAQIVKEQRKRGVVIFGEPIAASLALDGSHYFDSTWKHAAGYVLSPPLRDSKGNAQSLLNSLANGDLDCTGSDHCTFTSQQKALGRHDFTKIPNGVNGVEDRMSLIWEKGVISGQMSPERFVAVTSTIAAKIFNIYPQKGAISIGSDADILVWNSNATKVISASTHYQAVDFNVFEGMRVRGLPETVICLGVIVKDSKNGLRVVKGSGRFIPNLPHSPYVYNLVNRAQKVSEAKEVAVNRIEEDNII